MKRPGGVPGALGAVSAATVAVLLSGDVQAQCSSAGGACSDIITHSDCCGDLVCAFPQFVCRHDPPQAGEPCSVLVPCAEGLVCAFPQSTCRHDPPTEGEPCSVLVPCAAGLACINLVCAEPREAGEGCLFTSDCEAGLDCRPCLVEGCAHPFQCFPQAGHEIVDEALCLSLYSQEVHQRAIDLGTTLTFGAGSQVAVGVAASDELGTVYGQDGRYGCFLTTCLGVIIDISIGDFGCVGFYTSYEDFRGTDISIVEEAGEIIVFSTSQVLNFDGVLIGTEDCFAFSVSLAPITAGVYQCNTVVDTVIGNEAPTASCTDVSVCAGESTCTAGASVDAGSSDPDGDTLTTTQDPPGPYPIGSRIVTLSVSDADGLSDSCSGIVSVADCTAPLIVCPAPSTAECTGSGQAIVDPGDAAVTDCSRVSVTDPGPASYPLGSTEVIYTATDSAGNASSCRTAVTVVDTTPPAIAAVAAQPSLLWPPNHTLRTISVEFSAGDACDPSLDCEVVSVTSSEPDSGLNDGDDLPGDVRILGPTRVAVRAERNGEDTGRLYTITLECRDDAGNPTRATATVLVPHDARSREVIQRGEGIRETPFRKGFRAH